MDKERLKSLILEASDPDKGPIALSDLNNEVESLIDAVENFKRTISDQEGQIANLRDVNMKLFLRQTGEVENKEVVEKSPDERFKDYFDEMLKEN